MDQSQNFQNEAWGLSPRLEVPNLFPPAVMFTVRDSDPRPAFKTTLQKMFETRSQKRLETPASLTSEMMRQATLRAAWDSVFHDIPGDRIGLLIQTVAPPANSAANPNLGYTVGIMSTGPSGKKWLVTRATEFHEKSVCWCIPVEVAGGKKMEIVLTVENMITLESD